MPVERGDVPPESHVLVMEADHLSRHTLAVALEEAGFGVVHADDASQTLEAIQLNTPDVVVLGNARSDGSIAEVCRRIRSLSDVPIIVATNPAALDELVALFRSGATDCFPRPFHAAELVARLRGIVSGGARDRKGVIRVGHLEIRPDALEVFKRGSQIRLTPIEFKLLLTMAKHRGRAITREALLKSVWSYDYLGNSRLVDMAIKRLRTKIEDDPARPTVLRTVRGIGYVFGDDG